VNKNKKSAKFFSKDNILWRIVLVAFIGVSIFYFTSGMVLKNAIFLFVSFSVLIYAIYLLFYWRNEIMIKSADRLVVVENTKSMKDIIPESSKLTKLYQLAILSQKGYTDEQIFAEAKKYNISSIRMGFALQFQQNPGSTTVLFFILVLGVIFVIGTILAEIFY
jgi:hypothetical protein